MSAKAIVFSACALMALSSIVGCSAAPPKSKNIALIRAAESGKTIELVQLIRAGADINATDVDGWNPYLAASSNGHFEAMKILKEAGANTDPGF